MESPPKRVTRARAAAKGKAPAPVKVATAAGKAKATRTMPPPPAPVLAPAAPITRRRTRGMTEEIEDESTQGHDESTQQDEPEPEKKTARTTRGRVTRGKAAQTAVEEPIQETKMEEAPKAPAARTRRTATKKSIEETPVEVAAAVPLPEEEPAPKPAPKTAPSRITRRVVRKIEVAPEEPAPAAAAPKRTVRSRATTTTKSAPSKKSVDFAEAPEQDKENLIEPAAAKSKRVVSAPAASKEKEPEPAATGLRAKPVRKPAARTAAKPAAKAAVPPPRTTRGRATSTTSKQIPVEDLIKSPLSPKKVSQLPQPTPKQPSPKEKDDSDDELATMEKTPMRPLEKTPFKAPASVIATANKLDFTTSVIANPATTSHNSHLGESIMASPARRIPQSPWKGAIKESAKKAGPEVGQSLLQSPKKLGSSFMTSPFKSQMAPPSSSHKAAAERKTLMQSPARRPPSPVKVSRNGSPTRAGTSRNMFGATPKASASGVSKFSTPNTLSKSAFRPSRVPSSGNRPQTEARPKSKDGNAPPPSFNDIKPFTGRLSSVLPRYADPVMRGEIGTPVVSRLEPAQEPVVAVVEDQASAVEDNNVEMSQGDEVVPSTELEENTDNQVTEEETQAALNPAQESSMSTTPTQSPPVNLANTYVPRDESPFDDTESENESEDELATNSPLYTVKMSSAQFAELSTPKKKLNFQGVNKTPVAIGFTPLASQLNKWHAPTPGSKAEAMSLEQTLAQESPKGKEAAPTLGQQQQTPTAPTPLAAIDALAGPSPAIASSFFDDEMMIREDEQMINMLHEEGEVEEDVVLDALEFAPEDIDDEDLDLVEEANELSMIEEMEEMDDYLMGHDEDDTLEDEGENAYDVAMQSAGNSGTNSAEQSGQQSPMETEQNVTSAEVVDFAEDAVVNAFNRSMDSALSEASQEYGDENAPPAEAPTSAPAEQVTAPTPLSARQREKQPSAMPTPLGARRLSTPKLTPKLTPKANTTLAQQGTRRSIRTPSRPITEQRTVHTVSKVPLKPAAADSPIKFSPRKMPATIARGNGSQLPRAQMPTSSSASRTANTTPTNMRAGGMRSVSTPTPTKSTGNLWSNTATPARTPVRPAAEGVLKGAVVFVDVHTTEGADASAVFIDLLTQMGARCVKSWGWNPSTSPLSSLNSFPPSSDAPLTSSTSSNEDAGADSRKIGITHVVFKDGSKRTMEKVRDTKGVVSCVGVGWVLDCEREARWLDESEYKIDTAHVPRGGARRRKSMEPRALANMNGTLVTPGGGSKGGVPQTEKVFRRRDSTQWARNTHSADNSENEATPKQKKVDQDGDIDMLDYSYAELSPLPQTPAPAKIEEYSQHDLDKLNGVVPETPYHFDNQMLFGQQNTPFIGDLKTPQIGYTPYSSDLTPFAGTPSSDGVGETPQPLTVQKVAEDRNALIMRIVPVKRHDGARQAMENPTHPDSQALMQRLMAARRKSLQWAPKIGSPLARGSNYSPQK